MTLKELFADIAAALGPTRSKVAMFDDEKAAVDKAIASLMAAEAGLDEMIKEQVAIEVKAELNESLAQFTATISTLFTDVNTRLQALEANQAEMTAGLADVNAALNPPADPAPPADAAPAPEEPAPLEEPTAPTEEAAPEPAPEAVAAEEPASAPVAESPSDGAETAAPDTASSGEAAAPTPSPDIPAEPAATSEATSPDTTADPAASSTSSDETPPTPTPGDPAS